MKYLERLQQTEGQKDEKRLKADVKQASLQMQSSLIETQLKVESAEQELENLKSSRKLCARTIIDKQTELEAWKDGLERITTLIEELF